jgi:hypothetical protein
MTTFIDEPVITLGVHRLACDISLYSPGMPVLRLLAGDWVNVMAFIGTRVRVEHDGYWALVGREAIA